MTELPRINDYEQLFINDVPLMDVRAPVEYERGSFPHTTNLPLIDNEERHDIGIMYKEEGQDQAIELGHELVSGELKQQRVTAWKQHVEANPDGVLFCFRGGMRSRITQQWIYEHTGVAYPLIEGGYKALRNYLLDQLEISASQLNARIIGGRTGVGKTILIKQLSPAIDLEGLAWHRGSAFGRHATPQPSQIDFENALSIALLKHRKAGNPPLALEDEGRAIGSLNVPQYFHEAMSQSPIYILDAPLENRVDNSLQEYVHDTLAEYVACAGEEDGFKQWSNYLLDSVDRIKKRLGGDNYKRVKALLERALDKHLNTGDTAQHREWIEVLLRDYYDPMYDYQLTRKQDRIQYTGSAADIREMFNADS
ncbi:MAG: tRNA 2-selenouridine(34) synthase MnmH [bacterium]